ncbi:class I tRNA ligase family protein [uncultured Fibrobacter sp.]|uniref:class I tRNA ligase family protein n=1 Tax=uncultured Fibrobacter sp. TaxID=261512 RepID=UPI0025F37875|nr:class I tRNA ligase family protein [uncultured Fibrobacter sp.]
MFVDETAPEAIEKVMHQTVIKVTSDIENMSFNTAISQLMIFNNEMMKMDKRYREPCETFVKLLHPFAPHIAEEMWSILGVFYTKAALEKLALENERMKEFMAGKTVVKSIVVPGKLVNIVVK